jgi:hypothetical protein
MEIFVVEIIKFALTMRMKSIKRIQKYPPERKLIAGEKQNNVGLFQIIVFTVRVRFTARSVSYLDGTTMDTILESLFNNSSTSHFFNYILFIVLI